MEHDVNVPYIVFESSMARAERQIKRLTIALILAVVLIVACNAGWLYVWSSYEFIDGYSADTTYTQDGEGVNIIGDHNYESDSNKESQNN